MLVLSRKIGESIVIGNDITVTVIDVRGDRVRLAFECPTQIPVHREEVYRRIHGQRPASLPPAMFNKSCRYAECA